MRVPNSSPGRRPADRPSRALRLLSPSINGLVVAIGVAFTARTGSAEAFLILKATCGRTARFFLASAVLVVMNVVYSLALIRQASCQDRNARSHLFALGGCSR